MGDPAPVLPDTEPSIVSKQTTEAVPATVPESEGDESEEDESEILEESPCGRWLKRREEVSYRDVPGIDCAYLAMDTEEGVEVVWNEAMFSETKKFKAQEDKLKSVFEVLTLIDHPNIVKFHRYWTDHGKVNEKTKQTSKPRVILITEFMSSGSLKQFLKKTKKNSRKIPLQSWKRWCSQILSALSYLHSLSPPIIHGNLTCDTIFIQHNGLVKIGSVAPDAIHKNVKTFRENIKNFHFLAPEWAEDTITLTPAIDIFAFGMCALETAALELATNGETGGGGQVTPEAIEKSIDSLEDEMQKDFIRKCLITDPLSRPNARDLLFHPVLFEVHSLKLLAAHTLVKNPASSTESVTEEAIHRYYGNNTVLASLKITAEGVTEEKQFKLTDFPVHEKLEKFMEDVKFGIYPLTAFAMATPTPAIERPPSPESQQADMASEEQQQDVENRRIQNMQCSIQESGDKKDKVGEAGQLSLRILLRFEDKMNRQLSCLIDNQVDSPVKLAEELVQHGFIHPLDSGAIQEMLYAAITKYNSCETTEHLPQQFDGVVQ
eukprot:TRINITY_DN7266_c0_g1_i1.p1 TRINITY_DN7266_c0_g1~~TRINITY_DN7266_c0_g1_i1.p1  ORF type:complete len:548 (-),score=201.84 TRINITY_DN7266_c0_g1_i1:125-1768(-)